MMNATDAARRPTAPPPRRQWPDASTARHRRSAAEFCAAAPRPK